MRKQFFFVFSCFFLLISNYTLPAIKGSEIVVSVEPFFEFAQADSDNTMLGFGWFKNGFALENSSTDCTFDSVYPVAGTVNLNGGTLTLNRDLVLQNVTTLQGLGTITGNNYLLDFSSSVTYFQADYDAVFQDVVIKSNGDITIAGKITFTGECVFDGKGNALVLGDNAEIIIDSNSRLCLHDVRIDNINSTNIRCVDETAQLFLNDIDWVQNGNFTFSDGSISFFNNVNLLGKYTFTYDSPLTSTINTSARLRITEGVTLTTGKHSISGAQPFYFVDANSLLNFDGCSVSINSNGIIFTRGKLIATRDITIDMSSTSTANGLQLGDGIVSGDVQMEMNPGATVRYNSGHIVYDVTNPNGLKSRSKTTRMIRAAGTEFYIKNDIAFADITSEASLTSALTVVGGSVIDFTDSKLVFPTVQFVLTGTRQSALTTLLAGSNSLTLLEGTFPTYLSIEGTGNVLDGNGNMGGTITLQNSTAQLTSSINGLLLNSISLNSGTLTLGNNQQLGAGIVIAGPGTVNLSTYQLSLGAQETTWASNIIWSSTSGVINLYHKVNLSGSWTVNGTCTIDGNGNTLDLDATGEILVGSGSTLILKNVRLENISGTNIRCLGSDSVIILDQINWLQSGHYIFGEGALQSKNKVTMQGNATFAYQTDQTSTIMKESVLKLDKGFTFSYDPVSSTAQDLLEFIDNSSHLLLNSASLCATVTGMQLQKGSLFVRGNSTLCCETKVLSATETINVGITFGDNSDANNDFVCEIFGSAELKITQGSLNYQNINSASMVMLNTLSSLTMDANTTLRLYQNIPVSPGRIMTLNNVTLARPTGKGIIGSFMPLGKLTKTKL